MKILIFSISLLVLLMPGCVNIQEPPNEEVTDEYILQSYSLEALRVTIDFDKLQSFKDPNWDTDIFHYKIITSTEFPTTGCNFADTSILTFQYYENNTLDYMDAIYMTAIYKPVPKVKYFIKINTQLYSLTELEDYTIYEDNKIMIFDITDLLPIVPFEEKIEKGSLVDRYTDFQWMLEVYQYLKTYEDISFIYLE